MKVLVTGGAGYLGSVVSLSLLEAGHDVRTVDSLMHGGEALLPLLTKDRFEYIPGDLRATDVVARSLEGTEAVVHLAAVVGDPACAKEPDLALEVNQHASLDLIEASRRAGIERFVFASTCSNYGRAEDPDRLMTETSELRPVSLYAETKVAVERALTAGTDSMDDLHSTVLRLATLYGLSPRMRFDLTVNEFTAELGCFGSLSVYGEQFWRPYVHVTDAARAIMLVLEAPEGRVSGQIFNVGHTEENYTKKMLVGLIAEAVGGDLEIEWVERSEDPRDYRVSFDKIVDVLGFLPRKRVPDGIDEVLTAIRTGIISDPRDARYRN
jgi:nucleoside-diphosphate-sugar epimerase